MNIKLEQYKIFNEAASTLSFSQAARNLYITQSAISQAINALEKEIGAQLFIRHPRGVSLTKEGEILHWNISQALNLITDAENTLTNLKELKTGELRIGTGDALCHFYLMDYLVQFHNRYPDVHIKVINGTSLETIEHLKSGQLDLAFVNLPLHDDAITMVPCLDIHDIFVAGTKHTKTYRYADIAKENLILLERLSNSRRYVDSIFAQKGIYLKPEMELGAHELLVTFAKANLGISCVIKEFVTKELENEDVYEIQLDPPLPKRSVGYAYLSRVSQSAATMQFIKLIEHEYES